MLFLPFKENIYIPLYLSRLSELDSQNVHSYRNNCFLDLQTLPEKYQELLKYVLSCAIASECQLLIIGQVKNIIPKVAKKGKVPFKVQDNEHYYLIQIEEPSFILGFEDDDHSIKNFVF